MWGCRGWGGELGYTGVVEVTPSSQKQGAKRNVGGFVCLWGEQETPASFLRAPPSHPCPRELKC